MMSEDVLIDDHRMLWHIAIFIWIFFWKSFFLLSASGGGCFDGRDLVNLIDGGQRAIEHLNVGDRIWSLSSDGQTLIPDEIIMMMHNGPNEAGQLSSPLSLINPLQI